MLKLPKSVAAGLTAEVDGEVSADDAEVQGDGVVGVAPMINYAAYHSDSRPSS